MIYHSTQKERDYIFRQILSNIQGHSEKLNRDINKLKGMQSNLNRKSRKKVNNLEKELSTYQIIYDIYNQAYQNEWTPAPLLENEQFHQNDIMNSNISFIIEINNFNSEEKNNYFIIVKIYNGDIEMFNRVKAFDIDCNLTLSFGKGEIPDYKNKKVMIILGKKSLLCCSSQLGQIEIYLDPLQNPEEERITGFNHFKDIKTNSIRNEQIEYNIYKNINNDSNQLFPLPIGDHPLKIRKVFQPFSCPPIENYDTIDNMKRKMEYANIIEEKQKRVEENSNRNQIRQKTNNRNPPIQLTEVDVINVNPPPASKKVLEKELSKEEIDNPEGEKYIGTIATLEIAIKKLDHKREKTEGMFPKELRQLRNRLNVKRKQMIEIINSEQITLEQYCNEVKSKLNHDEKLKTYFSSINDNNKTNIVQERINILIGEVKSIEECIKSHTKLNFVDL